MTRSGGFRKIALALMAAALVCLVVFARAAHAKEVTLEWKPVKGAVRYELVVERGGKAMVRKTLEENKWTGDVPFGFLTYRLRAIDKLERPGSWSDPKALVALPKPPRALAPEEGDRIESYEERAAVTFRWKAVDGVSKYEIDVRRAGQSVLRKIVGGTELVTRDLEVGAYDWRINAIIEPGPGAPPSLAGRAWKSEVMEGGRFAVARKQLEAPVAVFPRGKILPPPDRKLTFNWKEVPGAGSYEVRVYKAGTREIAGERGKVFPAKGTSLTMRVPGEGDYVWEVRALVKRQPAAVESAPPAVGPKSVSEFTLDPKTKFVDPKHGYLALSSMVAPYTYRIVSPVTGTQASTSSQSLTLRLTGEVWVGTYFGIAAGLENTHFGILNQGFNRKGAEVTGKYRINVTGERHGWVLIPKAGVEYRQYLELRPLPFSSQGGSQGNQQGSSASNQPSFTPFSSNAYGPLLGVDIRRQFSEHFSMGVRVNYFYPMMLTGVDRKLDGSANFRNLSVGAQGLYWLSQDWGLGAGLFYDQRSISYMITGSGATKPQEIYMDGAYFFGSLLYTF